MISVFKNIKVGWKVISVAIMIILLCITLTNLNVKAVENIRTLNSKYINAEMVKKIQNDNLTSKNIKILDKKSFNNFNVALFTYDFSNEHYLGCSYYKIKRNKVEEFSGLGNVQSISKENPISSFVRSDTNKNMTNVVAYGEVYYKNVKYVKVFYTDGVSKLAKIQNNGYIVIRQGKKVGWPKKFDFLNINCKPVIGEYLWEQPKGTIEYALEFNNAKYMTFKIKNHSNKDIELVYPTTHTFDFRLIKDNKVVWDSYTNDKAIAKENWETHSLIKANGKISQDIWHANISKDLTGKYNYEVYSTCDKLKGIPHLTGTLELKSRDLKRK